MKELWGMALPITAMNMLVFVRAVVSVLFLGRLGSLELAGGALSIGFTNITGYSVLVGLAAGLEPVCSQAYGSKNWDLLSLSLQRMVLILLMAIVPISLLWLNLERIMLFMGQDSGITGMASLYCFYSLPDLLTNTLLQPLRVFLRSQKVLSRFCDKTYDVLFTCGRSFSCAVELFVGGGDGAGGTRGGDGVSDNELEHGGADGRVCVCGEEEGGGAEWWWYEIVTVLAGYLPSPTLAVAATGILIQTTSMMYTVPMALAGCVSTRVGNELGAGKPYKAKLAATVALGCAFVIGFINVTWTVILGQRWAGLFTKDEPVKALVASVMPIMGLSELGNYPQTTGCGILRGTARPGIGAHINLGSFYFVGIPVAVGLAFSFKVGFGGLWFGLLSAQVACAVSILYVVLVKTDWEAEALKAEKLTRVEMVSCDNGLRSNKENEKDEESKGLLLVNGNGNNKEDIC
ncbi:hypothetical protein Fmac_016232 [Flemingia macrophylla]|uniref:Protein DETOXIFICATION n=1 Tax=Flemingia macrophylla TaxID=520843 RepID=A0ABD1MGU9_9FABA